MARDRLRNLATCRTVSVMYSVRDAKGQSLGTFRTRSEAEARMRQLRRQPAGAARPVESLHPRLALPSADDLRVLSNLYDAWGKAPAVQKRRLLKLRLVRFNPREQLDPEDPHAFLTLHGADVVDEAWRRGLA